MTAANSTMPVREISDETQGGTAAWSRVLGFEGIPNFRDFGGYATADGRHLITGRLFRAAHQSAATDADLKRLEELGLGLVIDLRRPTERAAHPSRRPSGWSAALIDNDLGDEVESPHVAFMRRDDLTPAAIEEYLQDYYRSALLQERHVDLFKRSFAALPGLEGGVLIHCAAGKDRTGLLVALIQLALGVHRDDVVEDYVLTNKMTMTPERMALATKTLAETMGKTIPEEGVKAFLGVEGRYMDTALKVAADRFGSVEGYLQHLGVDEAERQVLAARYTV